MRPGRGGCCFPVEHVQLACWPLDLLPGVLVSRWGRPGAVVSPGMRVTAGATSTWSSGCRGCPLMRTLWSDGVPAAMIDEELEASWQQEGVHKDAGGASKERNENLIGRTLARFALQVKKASWAPFA